MATNNDIIFVNEPANTVISEGRNSITLVLSQALNNELPLDGSTPSDGELLTYSSSTSLWGPVAPTLAASTDLELSSPANGEVLAYDGVNWENRQESWAAFKRSAWWLFHSTAELTGTHVVGFRAAHPFYIPSSGMNCDAIGLRVRLDSPGAILRLGLYASDPSTGYPTDLIVDAGTVDCSTSGNKAATFTAVDLPPGLVWIAQHCTGANISGYVFTHTSSVRPGFPMPQGSLSPGTSWLNSLLMGANELVDEPLSSVYPSGQAQTRFANSCHLRYA